MPAKTLSHASHPPLAIIGFGNMGHAILTGGVAAGVLDVAKVVVAELDDSKREAALRIGVLGAFAKPSEALAALIALDGGTGYGQVLLAVKPQMLASATGDLGAIMQDRVVISILAGTPSDAVRMALGGAVRVVRVMPNLPAGIGAGATAIARGAGTTREDAAFATTLFRGVGPLVIELDEDLMDAFTAIAGSGPAYLFYLAEAMVNAAIATGMMPEQAASIVRQTLLGAADLLSRSPDAPGVFRAAVTSKGGTTAAAVAVLEDAGVMQTIEAAIIAARDRGRELAGS